MSPRQESKLEQVFEAVCELDTAARTIALDRACAGDPELRRQVEELLDALQEGTDQLLAHGPERHLALLEQALAPVSGSAVLAEGARIDRYRVVRVLGRGGTGTVYEAEHERIHRRVAIKVLHQELVADRRAAERFVDEARVVNIIRHPSIVQIYDVGRLPGGAAYIVMELLDGSPLSALVGRKLPDRLAIVLARQIASTLAAAHARGIVHRDLKPANVMVVRDPESALGERIKLLDFGIAKLSASLRRPGLERTDERIIAGTPKYMSPEQCSGGMVDGQSDVYGLGVILYELLAGEPPFAATRVARMFELHRSASPRPLAEIVPEVAPELVALVARMLAKDPDERPKMAQVVTTLDILAGALAAPAVPAVSDKPSAMPAPPQREWLGVLAPAWLGLGAAWLLGCLGPVWGLLASVACAGLVYRWVKSGHQRGGPGPGPGPGLGLGPARASDGTGPALALARARPMRRFPERVLGVVRTGPANPLNSLTAEPVTVELGPRSKVGRR